MAPFTQGTRHARYFRHFSSVAYVSSHMILGGHISEYFCHNPLNTSNLECVLALGGGIYYPLGPIIPVCGGVVHARTPHPILLPALPIPPILRSAVR
jgi:hypothetical protein